MMKYFCEYFELFLVRNRWNKKAALKEYVHGGWVDLPAGSGKFILWIVFVRQLEK